MCQIKKIETQSEYEALKLLWVDVFGDSPDFVDELYKSLNAEGYIAVDDYGAVLSSLTLYKCGYYCENEVFVSYAICTAPVARGKGIASSLTKHVRDIVLERGAISILSPAEESLIKFYSALDYKPAFFSDEIVLEVSDCNCKAKVEQLTASEYSELRESFLSEIDHIIIDENLLNFVKTEGEEETDFLLVNRGDAVCILSPPSKESEDQLFISELIVNPLLSALSSEIDEELACGIADYYGATSVKYRKPGTKYCQSMAARTEDCNTKSLNMKSLTDHQCAYFGFPLD